MPGPLNTINTANTISRMMDNGELAPTPDPNVPPTQLEGHSHTPMHLALGGMAAGQLADVLSTRAALARGGVEGNGVYGKNPSLARVAGVKALGMVPLAVLLDKLYNTHPKLAAGIALGAGGVGLGATMHNQGVGKPK